MGKDRAVNKHLWQYTPVAGVGCTVSWHEACKWHGMARAIAAIFRACSRFLRLYFHHVGMQKNEPIHERCELVHAPCHATGKPHAKTQSSPHLPRAYTAKDAEKRTPHMRRFVGRM